MLTSKSLRIIVPMLVLSLACARHPTLMSNVRMLMAEEHYEQALDEFEKMGKSQDDVLYLLEWALLLHYAGEYALSNEVFERAEVLSEDLYTKSISREVAAMLTSDLVLEYVPKPFEQVLVNYFRALNYVFLADKEGALVECRKASDKLALYSEEDKRPYRRDAFVEYLTGVLYEWDGEINDAFISYRNAMGAYADYNELFGVGQPPYLTCDAVRTASSMGFWEEVAAIDSVERARCGQKATDSPLAKVVVFVEQGFMTPKQEWAVNVPIIKSEARNARESPYQFSLGVYSRVYGHAFDVDDIAYFLRIAIPRYPEHRVRAVRPVVFLDNVAIEPAITEDIFAIARAELDHDMPKIIAKTLARAIIKYKATDKVEDKWGKIAGTVFNVATAATEQADLRGWLTLPQAVYMSVLYVEPGTHFLSLDPSVVDADGGMTHSGIELTTETNTTTFVRLRMY